MFNTLKLYYILRIAPIYLLLLIGSIGFSQSADLIYAEKKLPSEFDPVFGNKGFAGLRLSNLIHSPLYGSDKYGNIVYKLANSFPLYAADGKSLEIELRHGITWSDGKPLSSADVIFTWKVLRNMNYHDKIIFENIKEIKALDTYRFKIILFEPDREFHEDLFFPLIPRHIMGSTRYNETDEYVENPVTVGRYLIDDKQMNKISFKAHYWNGRSPQSGQVRSITVQGLPSDDNRIMAFTSRSTNFILDIPKEHISTVQDYPQDFGTRAYAANEWSSIMLNNKNVLLANKEARVALSMLFSVEQSARNRYAQKVAVITGPFTPGSSYYDETVNIYPFDEEGAKQKLINLGCEYRGKDLYYKGERVELRIIWNMSTMTNSDNVVVSDYINQLEDIGIKMTESAMSNPTLFQNTLSNRKDDYDLLFVKIKYPSDLAVISVFKSNAVSNYSQYSDAQTDDLMSQWRRASNRIVKIELGKKIHRRIHDQAPCVFLWSHNKMAGYNVHMLDNINIDPVTIFNTVTAWKAIDD